MDFKGNERQILDEKIRNIEGPLKGKEKITFSA